VNWYRRYVALRNAALICIDGHRTAPRKVYFIKTIDLSRVIEWRQWNYYALLVSLIGSRDNCVSREANAHNGLLCFFDNIILCTLPRVTFAIAGQMIDFSLKSDRIRSVSTIVDTMLYCYCMRWTRVFTDNRGGLVYFETRSYFHGFRKSELAPTTRLRPRLQNIAVCRRLCSFAHIRTNYYKRWRLIIYDVSLTQWGPTYLQ